MGSLPQRSPSLRRPRSARASVGLALLGLALAAAAQPPGPPPGPPPPRSARAARAGRLDGQLGRAGHRGLALADDHAAEGRLRVGAAHGGRAASGRRLGPREGRSGRRAMPRVRRRRHHAAADTLENRVGRRQHAQDRDRRRRADAAVAFRSRGGGRSGAELARPLRRRVAGRRRRPRSVRCLWWRRRARPRRRARGAGRGRPVAARTRPRCAARAAPPRRAGGAQGDDDESASRGICARTACRTATAPSSPSTTIGCRCSATSICKSSRS